MARKLYPIGIQTFERIRKEDKFYVDKTEYVYRMTHTDGKYFFLNRPRRFGKSLLASTFKSYFEGKKDFDAPTETMTTIVPLLYQSGYVTIKGYDKPTKLYLLALPNQEIRVGLYGSLLPHYLMDKSAKANTTIAKMSVLVKKGDMDAAFCLLNDFLETVPYCDNTNYEGHWQQTLYIMFALLTNYSILVEPHTAKGRIDIMMETNDAIYVMELKFNKSAEEALAQIDAKHYADAFKMSGKTS